jgi:hypothetical protein
MNYMQARSIFFVERTREVLAFMKEHPDVHHIVIMPAFSRHDVLGDMFDRQRCLKERVPYCASTAPFPQRRLYLDQLETWLNHPAEPGFTLLSSSWAYMGWRVAQHTDTKIMVSWVATVTPDISGTDSASAEVEQALSRYIGLDGVRAGIGIIPARKPFGLISKE